MTFRMNISLPFLCCPCCYLGMYLDTNPADPTWLASQASEAVGYPASKTTEAVRLVSSD